ncbi:LysE family translocator [Desulfovibrio desulfuricans]|uniref:LysE family translocator n=1 Tax=Desulfovibrio desulfuricans TaxID=876 RepID=A0A4V1CXF3_DESDE|nr:LysE family translocator [Desulfovibrio desulfuricans]QCC86020.1 LysE family translocator [Desulfovibrio desulfuricans]
MLTPDALMAFFATALLLGIAPGPDNIFVLTQSALFGARAGMVTTMGLVTGLCVHTTAVALGVAAIFQASALAFTLLKTAGAGYLLWLAWLSFRAGASTAKIGRSDADGGSAGAAFPGYMALYRRGIVMNVTNPKVSIFFLAFLPQFCDPARGSVALQVLSLGGLFMLATIVVFWTVAALGGRLAVWFNRSQRGQIIMQRVAGCVFVALAAALLLSSR